MRTILSFAALALVSTFSLHAQTAKQQAGIADDKKSMAGYAKSMNITCGSNIVVTTDYASYKAVGGVDVDNNAPWKDCRNATDTVELLCGKSEEQKKAVQQKIKTISCGYSPTEQINITGSTLKYSTPYGQGNPVHVKEYMDKNL